MIRKRIMSLLIVLCFSSILFSMMSTYGMITSAASTVNETKAELINYAKSFIGKTPYVWGGTSLSTGADCSGFICRIYEHIGIDLWSRRTSMIKLVDDGMAINVGTNLNDAQLGDIVYSPGHVSLYAGSNMLVSALNSKYGVIEHPATTAWLGGEIKAIIRIKDSYFSTLADGFHTHTYIDSTEKCTECGAQFVRSYKNINKTYKVIKNDVAFRSEPYSAYGKIYTRLKAGTNVTVKRSFENIYGNTWYEVSYGNNSGYIYSENLKEDIKKDESELSINLTEYPKSIKVGSGFGLRGEVKSNYTVKKVTGYIKQNDSVVQSSTDTPNSKNLEIKNANLNNKLLFNRLSAGNYQLYIEAVDSSGKKINVTKNFTVYEEQTQQPSTLSINLEKYPVTLSQGSSYGLRGSITSNYNISEVQGAVINSSGNTVMSSKDTPNTTSMDIRYADLNNSLIFNKLSAGNYTMKVVAYDTSGRQVTATKDFTVQGNTSNDNKNTANAASTLSINMTSYPSSINQGSSYGLRGNITSNYNITEVSGYIINSSGNTVMSSKDTPNSKSMDVKSANLNNHLVFNNLGADSYTLKIVAVDSSGHTREWSSGFNVNGGQSVSENTRTGVVNIPSSWDNLSIRNGPGTGYDVIGSMNQGETCTVYPDKASNGWYYINYNGITGYASGKQIRLQ